MNKFMRKLKIGLIFAAVSLFIFACAENKTNLNTNVNRADAPTNNSVSNAVAPENPTKDEIAAGGEIYSANCVRCHKEDGTGGKVVIDGKTLKADNLTTEHMKKHSDADLIDTVTNGVTDKGMPAYKDKLSAAEIQSVIKYVRATLQK